MPDQPNAAVSETPQKPPPPRATLKIIPASIDLPPRDVQAFMVEPEGLPVEWSIEPPQAGRIDSHGIYTAPDSCPHPKSVVVRARTPDGTQYGTASVTLSDAPQRIFYLGWYAVGAAILLGLGLLICWAFLYSPPRRAIVVVNPQIATLDAKKDDVIHFTAMVLGDSNNAVTWSSSDGRIGADGVYRYTKSENAANSTTVTVWATSAADKTRVGSAILNLTPAQRLIVYPSGISVINSEQVVFHADGAGPNGVTWRLSRNDLGTIDSNSGIYTAPGNIQQTETLQVTATSRDAPGVHAATMLILNAAFAEHPQGNWLLLLFVIIMGSLGSMIYYSSSFVSYVGNRNFRSSWFWFYISRPFVGGALAIVFFFIVGSHLISGTTASDLMSVAMVSALVGLFSDKAVKKLSDILDVLLAPKDDRRDKLPDTRQKASEVVVPGEKIPRILSTDPAVLKKNQPARLKVLGSNFSDFKVKINDHETAPQNATPQSFEIGLTAADTAHDKVTVAVINANGVTSTFEINTTA